MNKKQKKSLYRIILSIILLTGAITASRYTDSEIITLCLFAVPYLVSGIRVLKNSFKKIIHGQMMDENFLMSLATIGAFALGEYFEGVAVMLFFNIGELFESYAVGKSRKSISALMDIRPEYANLIQGNNIVTVHPEELNAGDSILIKPGERIPVDGCVTEGSSSIDTSALTGESAPQDVFTGSNVVSGCININGMLTVKVEKTYENSTVAKILELVENSSLLKSKSEKFITRFSKIYTPAVVFSALAIACIPPIFIGCFSSWLQKALIFLVVSCPCALVISVPLSFFSGIGSASKNGILIKGSSCMEKLAKADTVIFDKTGTLTQGNFTVDKILPQEGISSHMLLEYAAAAEKSSNHPIAVSIVKKFGKNNFSKKIQDVSEMPGYGMSATYGSSKIIAGNIRMMEKYKICNCNTQISGTAVHIAADNKYMGCILIADTLKPEAASTIKKLKELGIKKNIILTGDKKEIAEATAKAVGADYVHSELLPSDKVEITQKYIYEGKNNVIFAGDGINDAPALTVADIGISMGAMGSDAAIEAADIVLMDDNIYKVATAVKTARKTIAKVKQNIVFALTIKFAVMALALMGCSNMWQAVFADVGVSVITIINASMLLNFKYSTPRIQNLKRNKKI